MKRSDMIEKLRQCLIGRIDWYSITSEDCAITILQFMESEGMTPPSLDEETCQAILSVYYDGYSLNQWDEDISKDEKVMAAKARRATRRLKND